MFRCSHHYQGVHYLSLLKIQLLKHSKCMGFVAYVIRSLLVYVCRTVRNQTGRGGTFSGIICDGFLQFELTLLKYFATEYSANNLISMHPFVPVTSASNYFKVHSMHFVNQCTRFLFHQPNPRY